MKLADFLMGKPAVRIKTLVQKAYSPESHDYKIIKKDGKSHDEKNTTTKKFSIYKEHLMCHQSANHIQVYETSRKLRTTRSQNDVGRYRKFDTININTIQTTTSHKNNNQDSNSELVEKVFQFLNIEEKNLNFNGKFLFKMA